MRHLQATGFLIIFQIVICSSVFADQTAHSDMGKAENTWNAQITKRSMSLTTIRFEQFIQTSAQNLTPLLKKIDEELETAEPHAKSYLLCIKGWINSADAAESRQTLQLLRTATALDNENCIAYWLCGRELAKLNSLDQAEEQFRLALQADPNFDAASLSLAAVALQSGDLERAKKMLNTIQSDLDQCYEKYLHAQHAYKSGDFGNVQENIALALIGKSTFFRIHPKKLWQLGAMGFDRQGMTANAIACANNAVKSNGDDTGSRRMLWKLYRSHNQHFLALINAKLLQKLTPDSVEADTFELISLADLRLFSAAENVADRILDSDPTNPTANRLKNATRIARKKSN